MLTISEKSKYLVLLKFIPVECLSQMIIKDVTAMEVKDKLRKTKECIEGCTHQARIKIDWHPDSWFQYHSVEWRMIFKKWENEKKKDRDHCPQSIEFGCWGFNDDEEEEDDYYQNELEIGNILPKSDYQIRELFNEIMNVTCDFTGKHKVTVDVTIMPINSGYFVDQFFWSDEMTGFGYTIQTVYTKKVFFGTLRRLIFSDLYKKL